MVDRYLLDGWEDGLATDLRSRLAADFTGWKHDNAKFEDQFEWVVQALRTDKGALRRTTEQAMERRTDPSPPAHWQDFEDLCLKLWRRRLIDAKKNGRSGQPQAGVDIFGRLDRRRLAPSAPSGNGCLVDCERASTID